MYHDHKVNPLHIMIPKTSAYVKGYDRQTKWMYFLIEDDKLLGKCNITWDKVSADIKNNLIASLPILKNFCKPKASLMVIKLQIFMIKIFLWWTLIILI